MMGGGGVDKDRRRCGSEEWVGDWYRRKGRAERAPPSGVLKKTHHRMRRGGDNLVSAG